MRVHRSVFVKLVAVMLTMAIVLLLLASALFMLFLGPSVSGSLGVARDYARVFALTSPDLAAARKASEQLGVEVRYEGPDGAWATAGGLPSVDTLRRGGRLTRHPLSGVDYYLADAPNGGTYVLAWQVRRDSREGHVFLFEVGAIGVVLIVIATYVVLSRMLRPLRVLDDGVARLADGQLDVVLPPGRTRDEFGALTDAFNLMVRRVGEMIRARDQLLRDVSHELRSPLTRMKVALALLPESDADNRARLAADVAEMEAMIAELLELERLRDGRAIAPARQDLLPLLREVVAEFQDRPPHMEIIQSPDEVPLDFDREKIRIVLRNILENAVKYALPDSRPVEIAVTSRDGIVTVRLTDDGPGVPEGDRAQLFEPFFRVDRSRSKKTGGYGLGLSICKRIVEAHGGTIAFEPPPGRARGAAFVLTFRA